MLQLNIDAEPLRTIIADAVMLAMPKDGNQDTRFLNIKGAAEYMDCSEGTIRNWINEGRLPAYQWGRIIRVKLNELDALLIPVKGIKG